MRTYLFTIAALSFLLLGCSSGEVGNSSHGTTTNTTSQTKIAATNKSNELNSEVDGGNKVTTQRKVIYAANVDLAVKDFSTFSKQLPEIVNQSGGYVAEVNLRQRKNVDDRSSYRSGIWKVKVLSEKFDQFILKLSDIGCVESHYQTSEDVTEAYVDLNARIENKKRMESRILELINESNRKLSEIMNLEKELSRIRGEIEQMEGRLNLLTDRTEFATLTITALEKKQPVVADAPEFGDRVYASWSESLALLTGCVENATIFFIAVLPWMTFVGLLISVGYFILLLVGRLSKIRLRIRKA